MSIALRHPRFGRLLAALAVSQAGDWLYNLALLAFVADRTHSAGWLGVTTAARVAPIVLAGPLGGVIADRADRRTLMVASDLARAAAMGLLALVAVAGLPVLLVPVLAALATLAAAPYAPCVAATTPKLVPDADLPAANAARAAIGPVCIVAGPALGALLLLLGPPPAAFALNGLTFLASAALVASIPGRAAFRRAESGDDAASASGVLAELREGAAALWARPAACRLVSADFACSLVYGAQTVLLLLVAHRLGLGAAGYGYLLAAVGAGGVTGAVVADRLGDRAARRSTLAFALLVVAAPLPLLGMTSALAVALPLAFACGAGSLVVEVLAETGLQRTLPERVLGRAYGVALSVSLGGIVAGSLVAPLLVAVAGVGGAFALLGGAVVLLVPVLAGVRHPTAAVAPAAA